MTSSFDPPEAESEGSAQAQFGFATPQARPVTWERPDANGHSSVEEGASWPVVDPLLQPHLLGQPSGIMDDPVPQRGKTRRRLRRLGIELVETVILAALIFFAVRALAQNFRVEGSSMEPGLHNGQYLLVNKAIYQRVNVEKLSKYIPFVDIGDNANQYVFHSPHRGDVIVFRFPRDPDRDFIKRVIGVPGDTVRIANGAVFVNGVKLDEPYLVGSGEGSGQNYEEKVVPPGNYFVLGDNRSNSSDSRSWGFVPEENIIGQAMFSYWPFDDLGGVGNHSVDLGVIKLPLP